MDSYVTIIWILMHHFCSQGEVFQIKTQLIETPVIPNDLEMVCVTILQN